MNNYIVMIEKVFLKSEYRLVIEGSVSVYGGNHYIKFQLIAGNHIELYPGIDLQDNIIPYLIEDLSKYIAPGPNMKYRQASIESIEGLLPLDFSYEYSKDEVIRTKDS